ncbi:MAG TPA: hypothetical protein V6C76_10350 [Drouetiella sp.]
MSAKLIDLTELEKAFAIQSSCPEVQVQTEVVVAQPKKKVIRECADLRNFWDDDCNSKTCVSVSA